MYRFTSSPAGYGNRSGTVTAQALTGHTIRVTVAGRTVEPAVIDDPWDETGDIRGFYPGGAAGMEFIFA